MDAARLTIDACPRLLPTGYTASFGGPGPRPLSARTAVTLRADAQVEDVSSVHDILASGEFPHWNPLNALGAPLAVELPSIYSPFHWPLMKIVGRSRRQMAVHLDALEKQLAEGVGPWILGRTFSLADVSWLVIFERRIRGSTRFAYPPPALARRPTPCSNRSCP